MITGVSNNRKNLDKLFQDENQEKHIQLPVKLNGRQEISPQNLWIKSTLPSCPFFENQGLISMARCGKSLDKLVKVAHRAYFGTFADANQSILEKIGD